MGRIGARLKRLLLVLLSISVALAGCADNADPADDDGTNTTPGAPAAAPMTDDAARDLVEQALSDTPERYGFALTATRGGSELLRADATFDNATGRSHLAIVGQAAAFAPLRLPEEGLSIYNSPEGAIYRIGDVAVVQAAAVEQLKGIVPAQLLTPQSLLAAQGANLTVTGVQATTWDGEPAIRIAYQLVEDEGTVVGTATLLQEPARLVQLEATLPEDDRAGALSGATFVADIHYGDDAPAFPEDAPRLLGLGYAMRPTGGNGDATWTFRHSQGIPLADVTVLAQDASESSPSVAETPVAFQMTLADGSKSEQGVTLTFTDADADGALSQGDTLAIDVADDAAFKPQVVLYDAATETYVTSDLFLVFRTLFGGF